MQSDPEGLLWKDPPHYWERIVYPAYIKAHSHLFIDANVETGSLTPSAAEQGIVLLEASGMSMAELLDATCRAVMEALVGEGGEDVVGDETPASTSPVISDAEED